MLQVIPKWKITWTNDVGSVVMYISDRFMSNIMRKAADISFSQSGIENEPTEVKIELVS